MSFSMDYAVLNWYYIQEPCQRGADFRYCLAGFEVVGAFSMTEAMERAFSGKLEGFYGTRHN
jgi:hypothetical protein